MTARRRRRVILVALIAVGATAPVDAAPESPQPLAAVIHAAARWAGIAPELLAAVVWVESRGHPWALSIRGEALYPRSRAEAHALLQASRGHADIGVAQIHYPIWGPVFGLRPEDMLDAVAAWITIRGVNKRIAEILIAELGPDMHVFPTAKHAASWAGLCPGNHESAGKHRSGRTRHGNRWLRAALIEAALAASVRSTTGAVAARYRRVRHRGHKKAIVAVAHAILVTAYHLLARQIPSRTPARTTTTADMPSGSATGAIQTLERQGSRVTLEPAA